MVWAKILQATEESDIFHVEFVTALALKRDDKVKRLFMPARCRSWS